MKSKKKIDMDHSYRTQSGREVRIYAVDGCEGEEVHGAMLGDHGWMSEIWDAHGSYASDVYESQLDLVELPRLS